MSSVPRESASEDVEYVFLEFEDLDPSALTGEVVLEVR